MASQASHSMVHLDLASGRSCSAKYTLWTFGQCLGFAMRVRHIYSFGNGNLKQCLKYCDQKPAEYIGRMDRGTVNHFVKMVVVQRDFHVQNHKLFFVVVQRVQKFTGDGWKVPIVQIGVGEANDERRICIVVGKCKKI